MAHTKTPHTPIRVRNDLYARLKVVADKDERSIQNMLNRLIEQALPALEENK